ncbi:hypothetical protein MKW98_013567 [Papaver atlanticum]|uniref:Uncharacterized protein n=1 Tax=Papaver atlanticum TaxID=357466 RepID=A0AAD4T119_9MAGN|nr:hypothetical protein MKW98_013567 [Papaver atlanticum]
MKYMVSICNRCYQIVLLLLEASHVVSNNTMQSLLKTKTIRTKPEMVKEVEEVKGKELATDTDKIDLIMNETKGLADCYKCQKRKKSAIEESRRRNKQRDCILPGNLQSSWMKYWASVCMQDGSYLGRWTTIYNKISTIDLGL